ncbi:cytochrome c550 [Lysinibacillus odysseyi]|uniref:Cytochrome C551 n=1 Tax=Lysinibacillus odysseyi 34hs-1 = NBRC 100172 TaxID=1220589 RepID=A0A0A3J391_9BACI|nr:cytochrome c [Lysinibacillus odysseyi]KGR81517.1 cytochrome C551 [Lysinibacillus odysseyi 34hs-1 = NBRC 100172]
MRNNPLIPYVLIMAFGIGLIFFMSLGGAGSKDEAKEAGESGGEATADIDAEAIVQKSCVGCHGGDLTGGMGPNLTTGLDAAHVKEVVMNGQGAMPAVIKDEAEADAIAEYISGLK